MRPWDAFIQERLYQKNVTPSTLRYYKCVESTFREILDEPTDAKVTAEIIRLRQKGLSPTSINTYLRGLKANIRFRELPIKIRFQKTEQKILQTLSDVQVRSLLSFKPSGANMVRVHALTLLVLDTGMRATEALALTKQDCDMDQLVFKVCGKGTNIDSYPSALSFASGSGSIRLK